MSAIRGVKNIRPATRSTLRTAIKPTIMKHYNKNIFSYQVGDYGVCLLSEGEGYKITYQ